MYASVMFVLEPLYIDGCLVFWFIPVCAHLHIDLLVDFNIVYLSHGDTQVLADVFPQDPMYPGPINEIRVLHTELLLIAPLLA